MPFFQRGHARSTALPFASVFCLLLDQTLRLFNWFIRKIPHEVSTCSTIKNRLSMVLSSVQTNDAYNALGQRTFKQVIGGLRAGVERYVYGPGGLLLGVYQSDGTPIEETAYLDDGRPVGLARPNGSAWTTYPILTDQLGTPRQVLDPSTGTPVWTWEAKEPFGSERPNETVSGVTFTYRGRFPGQVFDEDTGLIHNGFRDYAPSVGRYVESDPIGLSGGWNTYAYTMSSPVNHVDLMGEQILAGKGLFQPFLDQELDDASRRSPTARALIDRLRSSAVIVTVESIDALKKEDGGDRFDPQYGKIYWDPFAGVTTTEGQNQSPLLQLIHELGHADILVNRSFYEAVPHWLSDFDKKSRCGDQYDFAEEKRNINFVERAVALDFGEPTRHNHRGTMFRAKSTTSTEAAQ